MSSDKSDRLAAVREKFVSGLKERAEELQALINGESTLEKRDEVQVMAHKIAGSAGFYGENAIAELAAKIDKQLHDEKHLNDQAAIAGDLARLIQLIRSM